MHFGINTILYLITLQEKYINLYKGLIHSLEVYTNAIKILSKGYLPISHLPKTKVQDTFDEVRNVIRIKNPNYDTVIKKLYYDIKLVTFCTYNEMNVVIQFTIFQPYIKKVLLYHIETVPAPTMDLNVQANSDTESDVEKHYIALNEETNIL